MANWLNQAEQTKEAFVQGWVLSESTLITDGEYNPLAAVLAMATASRENAGVNIGLACGDMEAGRVALGLSAPDGDWGIIVKPRRSQSNENFRCYTATMLLDMLRRYLSGQNMFPDIASLVTLESLHIPVDADDTH